jgi:hypothetical protein
MVSSDAIRTSAHYSAAKLRTQRAPRSPTLAEQRRRMIQTASSLLVVVAALSMTSGKLGGASTN